MKSKVIEKLRADKVVLGFCITPSPLPQFAEMAGMMGMDFVWIDYEHQSFTEPEMFNMCLAARAGGADSIIRIRKGLQQVYFRPFEIGANGMMYPHCMSADEARDVVSHAKFFPVGRRGADGVERHADYGAIPLADYMDQSNRENYVIMQIEDREAIDRIDEIAAVDGYEILFIGPGDLSISYGEPGGAQDQIQEAIKKVAVVAKRNGKHWGLPVPNAAAAEKYAEMGARFFICGAAIFLVRDGIQKIVDDFEGLRF